LKETLDTLSRMVLSLKATIVSREFFPGNLAGSKWVHVTIRKKMHDKVPTEIRYLILGGPGNGKSTIIASITTDVVDDGEGSARMHVMRHKHELDNGHTSCVTHHALGYDSEMNPLIEEEELMPTGVFFDSECDGMDSSSNPSDQVEKVCSLIDVAGHPRYIKTTIKGFMAYHPHFSVLTITAQDIMDMYKETTVNNVGIREENVANATVVGGDDDDEMEEQKNIYEYEQTEKTVDGVSVTINHARIARILGLKIIVVVTKSDLCFIDNFHDKDVLKKAVSELLRQADFDVNNIELHIEPTWLPDWSNGDSDDSGNTTNVPIFCTSSVLKTGVDALRKFLGTVEPRNQTKRRFEVGACLHLREAFDIPGVGIVAGGVCEYGNIRVGDRVRIGPDADARYAELIVSSIRTDQGYLSSQVLQGQSACLAFDVPPNDNVTGINRAIESSGSYTSSTWSTSDSILSVDNDADFNENDDVSSVTWSEFWVPTSKTLTESIHLCNDEKLLRGKNKILRAIIRKGAVVVKIKKYCLNSLCLNINLNQPVVREFQVELLDELIDMNSRERKCNLVQKNWHFVVYANAVKQTAYVTAVACHSTIISLRFMKRSEYLCKGQLILMSSGSTVASARVIKVSDWSDG